MTKHRAPQLLHLAMDPFSRLARLACREYGMNVELSEERPWERRPQFVALNPAGRLPVLIDGDGAVAAGIEAVCEYLDETRGANSGSLIGKDPASRAETRRIVAWFNGKFHHEVSAPVLDERIIKRLIKAGGGRVGEPDSARMRAGAARIRHHLDYLGELADARTWLAGDELTLADLAAAAHLSSIDYLGAVPWSKNPAAKSWYQRIKSRPSFRPLLMDTIRDLPPPRHYTDLDF